MSHHLSFPTKAGENSSTAHHMSSWLPYLVLTAISKNKVFEYYVIQIAYENAVIAYEMCKAENFCSKNNYVQLAVVTWAEC